MSVKKGDNIKVDYEGKLESGEVFDSSTHGDHSHPLEFEVGSGSVIAGFEAAVIGMKVGDEKEFKVTAEEGYGEIKESMLKELPRKALPKLPDNKEPTEGMTLLLSTQGGQKFPAKISKLTNDSVTIDLNHPLAGKTLIFKIKLVSIN